MILSLSEISTVDSSFAEDVEAYAAAGFDAIGIWEFKLPLPQRDGMEYSTSRSSPRRSSSGASPWRKRRGKRTLRSPR